MVKKLLIIGVLLAGAHTRLSAQVAAPEYAKPLTSREQITGIGTTHTVYTTELTITDRCKGKIEEYIQSDPRVQSSVISAHTIDIIWNTATEENVIFFYEKLEFQYLFPCSK